MISALVCFASRRLSGISTPLEVHIILTLLTPARCIHVSEIAPETESTPSDS